MSHLKRAYFPNLCNAGLAAVTLLGSYSISFADGLVYITDDDLSALQNGARAYCLSRPEQIALEAINGIPDAKFQRSLAERTRRLGDARDRAFEGLSHLPPEPPAETPDGKLNPAHEAWREKYQIPLSQGGFNAGAVGLQQVFFSNYAPVRTSYLNELKTTIWGKKPCDDNSLTSVNLETINWNVGGGVVENSSSTTITSSTDRQKIKQDPLQAMLTGRANFGPWFLTGQVTFAGTPSGNFSDVFFATPAFNTTATINSGNVYGFNGDAGYTVWNAGGWKVGIFGGYYSFNEGLYGMFPGFAGTFPLLSDHWRAGEGGVSVDRAFTVGAEPFNLNVTVAGLYDNLRAGAFNGNGGGVRANGTLSFPLGPVIGNVYAQYANLNASGSNTGVPLTFKDEVWTVGFGVTYKFGVPPAAAAPTYPVKALPPK
jgi:hypothetical protein